VSGPCATLRGVPEDHFGEEIAARYDDPSDEMFQPAAIQPVVDFLAALAGDGAALELGIGTGRIALPLAQRGVEVHGIDLSSAMVARLRAKPGGDDIPVAIGDFATTRAEGTFSVAYLVFNTINNLTTQDAQIACFENAAAHLTSGGHFVIEVGIPQLQRLPPGETVRAFTLTPSQLGFDEFEAPFGAGDEASRCATSRAARQRSGATSDRAAACADDIGGRHLVLSRESVSPLVLVRLREAGTRSALPDLQERLVALYLALRAGLFFGAVVAAFHLLLGFLQAGFEGASVDLVGWDCFLDQDEGSVVGHL
jgi:SAM-dependent methyltransferase